MKKITFALLTLCLSACAGGVDPVDNKKFLNGLDGPNVPTVQETLMDSARNAEKSGNYQQASQIYQQALGKEPDNKDIALALANSYRRNGEYDRAIAMYDLLLAKDAAMLDAREGKALAMMAKGDFETPVKLLQEVVKVDPTRWKSLNALGILACTRQAQGDAQHYFSDALKYHPDSPTILNNIGLSQAINGDYDTAISSLLQASSLSATGSLDRKRIDLNTALVYAIAGKLDEAQAIAEKYFTRAELDNNLGLYAHLANDDQMARSYLNMALTESKVFYQKAWDNLQDLSDNDMDTGKRPVSAKQASRNAKKIAVPAAKPEPASKAPAYLTGTMPILAPVAPAPLPVNVKPASPASAPVEEAKPVAAPKEDRVQLPPPVEEPTPAVEEPKPEPVAEKKPAAEPSASENVIPTGGGESVIKNNFSSAPNRRR